jgi:hypothetical protein
MGRLQGIYFFDATKDSPNEERFRMSNEDRSYQSRMSTSAAVPVG